MYLRLLQAIIKQAIIKQVIIRQVGKASIVVYINFYILHIRIFYQLQSFNCQIRGMNVKYIEIFRHLTLMFDVEKDKDEEDTYHSYRRHDSMCQI